MSLRTVALVRHGCTRKSFVPKTAKQSNLCFSVPATCINRNINIGFWGWRKTKGYSYTGCGGACHKTYCWGPKYQQETINGKSPCWSQTVCMLHVRVQPLYPYHLQYLQVLTPVDCTPQENIEGVVSSANCQPISCLISALHRWDKFWYRWHHKLHNQLYLAEQHPRGTLLAGD